MLIAMPATIPMPSAMPIRSTTSYWGWLISQATHTSATYCTGMNA